MNELQLRIFYASRKMELNIFLRVEDISMDLTRLKVRNIIETRTKFCIAILCIVNQDLWLQASCNGFEQWLFFLSYQVHTSGSRTSDTGGAKFVPKFSNDIFRRFPKKFK